MGMSEEATPAAPPVKPPRGPSKTPLFVGIVNVAMSGFLIFNVVRGTKPAAAAVVEKAEDHNLPCPTVAFDPLVINLNEPGSNRYLKASFEIEVSDEKAVELMTLRKRIVRDEVLRYLSGLGIADTLGEANKTKIKDQLIARADQALGKKGTVRGVYFTEFVVQ